MNILKSELKSVPHEKWEAHTFTSLGLATGYSRANIHILYAQNKIKVLLASINPWDNILIVSKDEVARLREYREVQKRRAIVSKARAELRKMKRKLKREIAKNANATPN